MPIGIKTRDAVLRKFLYKKGNQPSLQFLINPNVRMLSKLSNRIKKRLSIKASRIIFIYTAITINNNLDILHNSGNESKQDRPKAIEIS